MNWIFWLLVNGKWTEPFDKPIHAENRSVAIDAAICPGTEPGNCGR